MKLFSRAGLALAFCFAFTLASAQDPAEIKQAQQLLNKDKKKGAIELLQKATATNPAAANLFYYLGRTQLLTGDKAGAKASFEKGTTANPKEPLNFVGLGHLLILDKNAAGAKAQFDKAISLGKKNAATYNAIGDAYLSDKAYQKDALTALQKSKDLNDGNPDTYLLLGDAYSGVMGQGGLAASSYERGYEIDSKNAKAWFKLGELYMSTNIQEAEKDYQQAVTVDPEFAEAHRELGELYYKKKDGLNAAKHYKKYLDLTDSPEKDDRFRYAFFLFMAKDYDNANREFETLLKKTDVTSLTQKFAAQSQLKAGNLAESERIFTDYMKNPQTKVDADDYKNLGDLRVKQGKDSLAMTAYESSVALDQTQTDVLQTLSKYYLDKKKYPDVERISRISNKVRKTPSTTDYFNLGRSLYLQQKYVNADSAFSKVIELQPKFVQGYMWAARAKSAQDGDVQKDPNAKIDWLAKPNYEKLIEIAEPEKDKNKKELIEAYQYMVGHHLFKNETAKGKEFLNKILELDPENALAKQTLKELNNPQPQQKPKPKPKK